MALHIAERIRKSIESEKMLYQGKILRVTVSIGIATLDGNNYDTIEDLTRAADENLYEAKQTGRNRTIQKKAA